MPTTIPLFLEELKNRRNTVSCSGVSDASAARLLARIHERVPRVAVIAPTPKDCSRLARDLRFFGATTDLMELPAYKTGLYKEMAWHGEIAATRINTLYKLVAGIESHMLVMPVKALLQKLIPKRELADFADLVIAGEETDRNELAEKLVSGGYKPAVIVEEPGDFCIRGSIIDVFSPMHPRPFRMEFFDDLVESVRFFSASTQRTVKDAAEAVILPAGEIVVGDAASSEPGIRERAGAFGMDPLDAESLIRRIREERIFSGIENHMPLIYEESSTVFDYLGPDALIVKLDAAQIKNTAEMLLNQAVKDCMTIRDEGRFCLEPSEYYMKPEDADRSFNAGNGVAFHSLPVSQGSDEADVAGFDFHVEGNDSLKHALQEIKDLENPMKPLADRIGANENSGIITAVVCGAKPAAKKIQSLMGHYGVSLDIREGFPASLPESAFICLGDLSQGFAWPAESLAVITEEEIFGRRRKRGKKAPRPSARELLVFDDLKSGDFVVHAEHGIGRYQGLTNIAGKDFARDFVEIEYRGGDKLYLPVERLEMVQKYMGVEGIEPIQDKLGGKTWDAVKKKAKKSAEKVAKELVTLYASRKIRKGHAFGRADSYFDDFEEGFAYTETPDQMKAINDVLDDMESEIPMDRLVCGDVGYGKTEVALRAAFKAACDGKQTAMLVPTTVLARQHYDTFRTRLEDFPVTLEYLSRFNTKAQQKEIVESLAAGATDIVIGTHRLVQKDIRFKDLGLVIIDEEQRFGVSHKEKLKKMRSEVDVLALTATPIPRTLHLSLSGIRDISVINTPPEGRQSITTYIAKFDKRIVAEAVNRELDRNGQIFFVHNNINNIRAVANLLRQTVPGVKLGVAHGRMDKTELEKVMMQFVNRDIDLLVCTSIIESGLDIPSANTIIINRAHRFGLAQIYQLRGRVGRSEEQAYAYLFIPDEAGLSRDAVKRLKVLMEHRDLGSGFQIAMKDLQIRGGGTILGVSQSGRIAAVGYDMFLQLMEEETARLKGEPVKEKLEPEINIPAPAYLPKSYIPDTDQRLAAYRTLSKMSVLGDLGDFKAEFTDRYGKLPATVENILLKIMLKILAADACIKRLDMTPGSLVLYFSEKHVKKSGSLAAHLAGSGTPLEFADAFTVRVKLSKKGVRPMMVEAKGILKGLGGVI